MATSRRVPVARITNEEPLLVQARKRVEREGGNLRLILRELREERKKRSVEQALSEAPRAELREDGTYARVSADPRWPFGVRDDLAIAPFGLSQCGLPRTVDPASPRGVRNHASAARREARELIASKLERLGCDPIAIMAEIAMNRVTVKDEVRLRAAAELASMVYPRLKSVESTSREEKTIFVIGVPTERPDTATSWLSSAEGTRHALIEGESRVVTEEE